MAASPSPPINHNGTYVDNLRLEPRSRCAASGMPFGSHYWMQIELRSVIEAEHDQTKPSGAQSTQWGSETALTVLGMPVVDGFSEPDLFI